MKEFMTVWNGLWGKTYDAVNTNHPPSHRKTKKTQDGAKSKLLWTWNRYKSAITIALLGLCGLMVGTFINVVNPYDLVYRWKLIFEEGGEIFELWRAPPVELYLRVHLWNVTNRDEYLSGQDDKLKLQEVGPYVYRELMSHENVTFNENGTLTTVPVHPLVWVPELSEGRSEDDLLILPNIALLMYDFDGDFETVYDGQKLGLKNIGLIEKYRGSTKIPQWESPCGDVTGASDGTKFPGYIQPNDTLLFFRKSMCRAKSLVKVNETIANGLKAYVYNFDPEADDNGLLHERNKCFCRRQDKCMPRGLLDVRGCYYGFPIALSYPHFLDGDLPALTANVTGPKPDAAKHRSYFVIQPDSGLPIELSRMDKLPDNLGTRFRLYLNVLPLMERSLMYGCFGIGIIFALFAIFKCVRIRNNKSNVFNSPWIQDEFIHSIDRKLSSYMPERRSTLNEKELTQFISSLSPLSRDDVE
nr:unnamed protein product [Callosobruchus analis]